MIVFQLYQQYFIIIYYKTQLIDINLSKKIPFNMIQTKTSILCPLCGIKFIPTQTLICPSCIFKQIKQQKFLSGDILNFCKYCKRYQKPPWINCQRQSQQIMSILLKKIKGLNKIQFQQASFVWTQPHSKRIKLKVKYNRQINSNAKMQVTQIVQFVQKYTQCHDCKKQFTSHDWVAVVQLRQQVCHKKTIHHFQQQIIHHKLSQKILKTQQQQGGLDFFFYNQNDANKLVDLLKNSYPCLIKLSSKLVSHNQRQNTSNVKTTYSCILPKICRYDLVHLPRKLSKQLGNCSTVLLCTKVSSYLYFIDPTNFRKIQMNSNQYFLYQNQIQIFTYKIYCKKYTVFDCQSKQAQTNSKFPSYGITFMKQGQYLQKYSKCHFQIKPGTQILGYQLSQIQNIQGTKNIPDYLMVFKLKDKQQKNKNKKNKNKNKDQDKDKNKKQTKEQIKEQTKKQAKEQIKQNVQQNSKITQPENNQQQNENHSEFEESQQEIMYKKQVPYKEKQQHNENREKQAGKEKIQKNKNHHKQKPKKN